MRVCACKGVSLSEVFVVTDHYVVVVFWNGQFVL